MRTKKRGMSCKVPGRPEDAGSAASIGAMSGGLPGPTTSWMPCATPSTWPRSARVAGGRPLGLLRPDEERSCTAQAGGGVRRAIALPSAGRTGSARRDQADVMCTAAEIRSRGRAGLFGGFQLVAQARESAGPLRTRMHARVQAEKVRPLALRKVIAAEVPRLVVGADGGCDAARGRCIGAGCRPLGRGRQGGGPKKSSSK